MSAADHAVKRDRVLAVLDDAGLDEVWLTSPAALGWYLEGARTHTSLAGPPVAAVRVDRATDTVRVYSNELTRLVAEELPDGIACESVDWHGSLVPAGVTTEDSLDLQLRAARAVLLPTELERYTELCRVAASILTDVLLGVRPEDTEREVAARLAAAVSAVGADPLVTMVAGSSRLAHRHPLPTTAVIGDRAMVVLCARRHGLIANVTRWVRFGQAPAEERRRQSALLAVEADILRATVPGAALSGILEVAAAAYPRHGFDSDEWQRHHQGGAAGYAGRDPRATPSVLDLVQPGQAFAWNPTAPAAKVEDTVLVGTTGIVVLTADDRWPTIDIDGLLRPEELIL